MATRLGRIPGVVLISVAAVMWGTDAIFRRPLAHSTSAATIVFGEHVILVAITLPLLVPALLALWRAGLRYVLAGIGVGAGASALATILFTQAFAHGDPITPIVLQKIQPLIAVAGAALLLGERPRPRFAWFLVPALLGIWLIGVQHPLDPHAHGLAPSDSTIGASPCACGSRGCWTPISQIPSSAGTRNNANRGRGRSPSSSAAPATAMSGWIFCSTIGVIGSPCANACVKRIVARAEAPAPTPIPART